jgi:zinc transport system substrate-binding protein
MKHLLVLLLLLLPWMAHSAPRTAPHIITTIAPVYALISAVTEGVTEPELLLPTTASPHNYTLTPADARKLAHAEIIFRIGHDADTFINTALASSHIPVIELMGFEGIKKLPLRKEAIWAEAARNDTDLSGGIDPHIWLDTTNATIITRKAAELLAQKDPAHARLYAQNAAKIAQQLSALDREISDKLAPYSQVPYLVTHDAYQYFEKRYHLSAIGAIPLTPNQAPDTRTITQFQDTITRYNPVCLFSTPQIPAEFIALLTQNTSIGTGIIEAEWGYTSTMTGKALYFSLMRGMMHHLIECFDKNRSLPS